MNYVGQLAGQVFVQVKELYRGLNPATLSGCIDVIVVRQPDGSLHCSPFHVRFGKMGVLRSREKVVDMEINGEPVDLHMKLGENGEAFFVQETENDQEVVPSYLATSPILSDGAILMSSSLIGKNCGPPLQSLGSIGGAGETGSGIMKKRRKRRRKARADSMRREESGDTRRMMTYETAVGSTSGSFKQCGIYTRSDGEWSPLQRCFIYSMILIKISFLLLRRNSFCNSFLFCSSLSPRNSRPNSPKSDSELMTQQSDADNQDPAMHWAWGELPQAATTSSQQRRPCSEVSSLRFLMQQETSEQTVVTVGMESESMTMESQTVVTTETQVTAAEGAAAHMMSGMEEAIPRLPGKTDSPSKKKDKRSRHLGSDGIYLDDITDLEPEVAALYFPKSDGGATERSISDPGFHSTSLSPQSVSSGGDSGVDSYCDSMADLPAITISLCGGLNDNREITKEQFHEKMISYQQFAENPSIIDDPNLVVKIGSKYYNWSTAAPLMLAMQAFQKPLPKAAVENIMKEKMPKKGGRWWFSWRGRNSSTKSVFLFSYQFVKVEFLKCCSPSLLKIHKEESSSSDEDHRAAKQSSVPSQSESVLTQGGVSYKKTLRLTSEQLLSLQLQEGPNDVVFSVTTQYQGTCRCQGTIYLWNWDDKIIISDIDGTITRSDTLGHILPTLGKDWTHQGIAQLYHKVSQNGYKFLYCSARAIGMADMTRGYLHWVNERGTMLPIGPVLLSPSSLFSALHREVIEKKPEKFKVECLTDIKNLFYPNTQPFYAAFGNRPTDVFSYKEVGVPLNRIFTVNPKGELVQEHAKTNISSYVRLGEVVDHVFPLKLRASSSDFPCADTFSHFTYWRQQLPRVEHHGATPPQSPRTES
uniref:phosphatidate phosphatase n=1 Tax=Labrus bergylta TaxID=56723 RepID=A0A3Q3EWL8_9LABR